MQRDPRVHRLARAAALALVLVAGSARAQAPDETQRRAIAQALFDEAQKLMEANSYSAACIKLEEVVRLQPGKIGALLALARCYEGEGKTASAWSRYKNAAESAGIARDPRQAEVTKKVGELAKKVPTLTLAVSLATGAMVGLSLRRDGVEVSAAQWGSALPMDPGDHHIEAVAPGKKPWASDVTLVEGRAVTVTIPDLEPDVPAAPTVSSTPPATLTATAPPSARPSATASPDAGSGKLAGLDRRTWGLIVGGVGVAGLAAGAISGGLALDQHATLAQVCPGGRCGADKRGDVEAYETLGAISTAGFVAGGVLAAAGAVLWLTAPGAGSASVRVVAYAGPGNAGIVGSF